MKLNNVTSNFNKSILAIVLGIGLVSCNSGQSVTNNNNSQSTLNTYFGMLNNKPLSSKTNETMVNGSTYQFTFSTSHVFTMDNGLTFSSACLNGSGSSGEKIANYSGATPQACTSGSPCGLSKSYSIYPLSVAMITLVVNNNLYLCSLNGDGTFGNCVITSSAAVTDPFNIVLDNTESIAYIVNNSNSTVASCTLNGNGSFEPLQHYRKPI